MSRDKISPDRLTMGMIRLTMVMLRLTMVMLRLTMVMLKLTMVMMRKRFLHSSEPGSESEDNHHVSHKGSISVSHCRHCPQFLSREDHPREIERDKYFTR